MILTGNGIKGSPLVRAMVGKAGALPSALHRDNRSVEIGMEDTDESMLCGL